MSMSWRQIDQAPLFMFLYVLYDIIWFYNIPLNHNNTKPMSGFGPITTEHKKITQQVYWNLEAILGFSVLLWFGQLYILQGY